MASHINQSSRTATAENDESADQIGNDTPRSGFATPEPDPQDKRLPGIMSYFGQVRPSSLQRLWSGTFSAAPGAAPHRSSSLSTAPPPQSRQEQDQQQQQHHDQTPPPSQSPASSLEPALQDSSEEQGPPLLPHERVGVLSQDHKPPPGGGDIHPYPTPPASSNSSLRGARVGEGSGEGQRLGAASPAIITSPSNTPRKMSIADPSNLTGRRASVLAPVSSAQVTESTAHAHHFSSPGSTAQKSSAHEHLSSVMGDTVSEESSSVHRLKGLTNEPTSKSGHSTPARALSTTHPSRNDGADERRTSNESGGPATGTQTPSSSAGTTQVPAAKGKLTVKISEARGLKRCRAPYLVVVFQKSELISGAPREDEEDDDTAVSNVAMGGVPIQRQPSDSGRPMAIPMRSRQSSNTSTGEFNSFRNRTHRRSFTNPKWDAEAVL